jgi:hypothetical protein
MATMRLRLTAYSLASLHPPATPALAAQANGTQDPVRQRLHDRAAELVSFYDRIAAQVGRVPDQHWPQAVVATPAAFPPLAPAELRRTPWWR